MALKKLTTDRLRSVVTSADRMSLTIFLAFALHALVVLGISFKMPEFHNSSIRAVDVTIVHTKTDQEVLDYDYLANANQKGGGNTEAHVEVTKQLTVQGDLENPGTSPNESFEASKQKPEAGRSNALTGSQSDIQINPLAAQDKKQSDHNSDSNEIKQRQKEITQLWAELNKQHLIQSRSKVPRVTFLDANTKEHHEAGYVKLWQTHIKQHAQHNFPEQLKSKQLKGEVELNVVISPSGALLYIQVQRPSGKPLLNQSAQTIVRGAAPFARIPKDVLRNNEVLSIKHTYRFE